MIEEQYYQEIEHIIKRNEINKKVRKIEENKDLVRIYLDIGRLIVEAQGGSFRAKYGKKKKKKWSIKLTKIYGKGYNYTNLSRFRQFYLCYPILAPSGQYLNWAHYRELLPIKDENKRNYYINNVNFFKID